MRSRLYLERVKEGDYETDPDVRTLSTKKANYGRTGGKVSIKWKAGVFVAEQAEQGLDRMAANAKSERVFLKLLAVYAEQGRTVNHASGSSYAPKKFADHPDSEGMTKLAFRRAMESLLSKNKIFIDTQGPPSKRRSFLVKNDRL